MTAIAAAAGFGGARLYLSSYLTEKGKNLATKEDIATITNEVETVKTQHAKDLEGYKSGIAEEVSNRLAEKRGEIDQKVNQHKHDLDKMVASAKLHAEHVFKNLPLVWETILDAQYDALMPGRWVPSDISNIGNEDLIEWVANNIPEVPRGILEAFAKQLNDPRLSPSHRRQQIDEFFFPIICGHSESSVKNAALLLHRNRIFLAPKVYELANKLIGDLLEIAGLTRMMRTMSGEPMAQAFTRLNSKSESSWQQVEALHSAIQEQIESQTTAKSPSAAG